MLVIQVMTGTAGLTSRTRVLMLLQNPEGKARALKAGQNSYEQRDQSAESWRAEFDPIFPGTMP
jgi:hypothetical protein